MTSSMESQQDIFLGSCFQIYVYAWFSLKKLAAIVCLLLTF